MLLQSSLQDNVFIISNLKSKYPVLQLDLRYATNCSVFEAINEISFLHVNLIVKFILYYYCRFISDLVVVIVSATCGGIAFACLGQPVSTLLLFSLISTSLLTTGNITFQFEKMHVARLSYVNLQFKIYCR